MRKLLLRTATLSVLATLPYSLAVADVAINGSMEFHYTGKKHKKMENLVRMKIKTQNCYFSMLTGALTANRQNQYGQNYKQNIKTRL